MSFIFNIGLDNISLFEDDRFLLPAFSVRGIKKTSIGSKKYISGIALGLRFWRWGWYLSIISQKNIAYTNNKFEILEISPVKVSIAKTVIDTKDIENYDITKAFKDDKK